MRFISLASLALASAATFVWACDSHDAAGGPVTGPIDDHCGSTAQATSMASCTASDAGVEGGADDAATDGPQKHEEHPTLPPADAGVLFNQSGADEECKYDFTWTSTAVALNENVTFTLTLKNRTDKLPALGAAPAIEAFLDATHPAPNSGAKSVEEGAGVYEIGPIRFDRSGYWTVRFHVYNRCIDGPTSPHGHAAFYVSVP